MAALVLDHEYFNRVINRLIKNWSIYRADYTKTTNLMRILFIFAPL